MTTDGSSGNFTFPGSDINADGHGDILWHNSLSGDLVTWYMSGSVPTAVGTIGPDLQVGGDWEVVGLADFNGDGVSDLLWRNPTTGGVVAWNLDTSGALVSGQSIPFGVSSDWTVVGTGDFDSDQKTDILWSNAFSGELVAWYMDGFTLVSGESLGVVSPVWQVSGVGDFNDDGNDDLVWHNQTSGDIVIWHLDGISFNGIVATSGTQINAVTGAPWSIQGTGDFNSDSKLDFLWWNSQTGELVAWYLDTGFLIGGKLIATIDTSWQPLSQSRGGKADLTVNNAVLPTSVVDGDTVNVSVDVINQGSKTSPASTLRYYLSEDNTFNADSDLFLGAISTKTLLAGESVNLTESFVYNASTMGAPGTKYLFFTTDANGAVNESNENNNVLSQTLNVVSPTPLNVDLTPQNVVIPPIWTVGNELTISVDVTNQGIDNAPSSNLFVYLLDSATFDPNATPILTTTVESLGPSGSLNSSTNKSFTFTYQEGFGTGQKYLYFVVDADGLIAETNEANNIVSNAITVGSVDSSIDFAIGNITLPSSVVLEQSLQGGITLVNQGETASPATTLRIYVSDYTGPSDTLDVDTADLVASLPVNALAGGENRSIPFDIFYSRLLGAGQKNIFFVVDADDAVVELNELNNVEKQVITATSPADVDLVISSASVSPTAIIPGGQFTISATVQNVGTVATGTSTLLRAYLSDDEIIDANDFIIRGFTINDLAGGASQTVSRTETYLSSDPAGLKYILFAADVNNTVFEQSETNNLASRQLTVNEIKPGIDLVIANASVSTTTLIAGDPLTVTATVQNQGETSAPTSKLGIYVSTDATYDAGDRLIAEFSTGSIPTYDTFTQNYTFNYLDEYGLEGQYILVVADHDRQVTESEEGNNVQSFAITVSPDLNRPDLVMDSIPTDPATSNFFAALDQGIEFDYIVKNQGLRETTQPFNIKFYLADQNYTTLAALESNALALGSLEDLGGDQALVPAESEWGGTGEYSSRVGFRTSQFDSSNSLWSAGLRYLIAVVDYDKEIRESDENNNIYSVSFNLSQLS